MELCLCLVTIVEARVEICDESNCGCVPFFFGPLVLGNVTLVGSQDLLDLLDILNGFCGKNSMEDKICCFSIGGTSCRFLIHLELSLVKEGIGAPLKGVDLGNLLASVVNNLDFVSKCFLDGLNPMTVDNPGICLVFPCCSACCKPEFDHFLDHRLIKDSPVAAGWWSDI